MLAPNIEHFPPGQRATAQSTNIVSLNRSSPSQDHAAERRHALQSAVPAESSKTGTLSHAECGEPRANEISMATRIAYAFILLINSILSWIMLTPWALKKLQNLTLDYMEIRCDGKECHGWVAVHRINFALGLFHLIFALLLLGVKSSKDTRAAIQNGYWGPKVILWLAFVVMSFFIPEPFFFVYGNYIAFFCAMLFLLLGLILLVDLAHSWAELCLQKIEDSDSRLWRGLLIGSTVGMYLASFVMTILMYIFFANSGCSMNQAAITVCTLQLSLTLDTQLILCRSTWSCS